MTLDFLKIWHAAASLYDVAKFSSLKGLEAPSTGLLREDSMVSVVVGLLGVGLRHRGAGGPALKSCSMR